MPYKRSQRGFEINEVQFGIRLGFLVFEIEVSPKPQNHELAIVFVRCRFSDGLVHRSFCLQPHWTDPCAIGFGNYFGIDQTNQRKDRINMQNTLSSLSSQSSGDRGILVDFLLIIRKCVKSKMVKPLSWIRFPMD
jgi:hypothetical protein